MESARAYSNDNEKLSEFLSNQLAENDKIIRFLQFFFVQYGWRLIRCPRESFFGEVMDVNGTGLRILDTTAYFEHLTHYMMFTLKKLFSVSFFFTTFLFVLAGHTLRGENLVLWISSFQDQVYYEKMGELSPKKRARSWTSRSRPTVFAKCRTTGVAFRTGKALISSAGRDFFGVFINGLPLSLI